MAQSDNGGGSLTGKVALVTGSSRGLGRAIALSLARDGAHIVVHYLRKQRAASEVVKEIESRGVRSIALKANLSRPDDIEALFDQMEQEFSGCDIFVGNAATGLYAPVMELDDKRWDWTMDVNARSVLHCAKRAVPFMERNAWGRIVTVTSLGSERNVPHYAAVGLSKAALEALTRYLAVELAPKGIVVNAVSPGLVETDSLSALPFTMERVLEHVKHRIPGGELVTAEDIGNVVAFLCTDAARMIVGQTVLVDGGYGLLTDYFPLEFLQEG